jgi:hypothetical protein
MKTSIYYYNNFKTFTNILALGFNNLLQSKEYISPCINNIICKIDNKDMDYNSIKAWKYNYISDIYNENNIIFHLEYKLTDNSIKINYLMIDNDYYSNKFNKHNILSYDEYMTLKYACINYIENEAIKNGIDKIIIDIHRNMERYNYELKDIGFVITDRRCIHNLFWYEAEKMIKK